MNQNTKRILDHISLTLLDVDGNINKDGTPNFNFIEADIYLDISEGKLTAQLVQEDIDSAFGVLSTQFIKINAAIDKAVVALGFANGS